ncbi:Uncharacterized protein At4g02000 [Linum perenne]
MVRLLGKSIGYSYLCHRLRSMWRPTGDMHIVDLDKSCFLVKFGAEQDYFKVLTGGPWILLDHYLIVHQWTPAFRVSNDLPKKMVAWVRFPHLPIHFYHSQVLTSLGNLIGRTIKIDFSTQKAERGKFARIAIEIDLGAPLPPVIVLDGALQQVEYENLPTLCFSCGRVGHDKDKCPNRPMIEAAMGAVETLPTAPTAGVAPDSDPTAAEGYDPWMMVSRKSRRNKKGNRANKESTTHQEGGPKKATKIGEPIEASPLIAGFNAADMADVGGSNSGDPSTEKIKKKKAPLTSSGGASASSVLINHKQPSAGGPPRNKKGVTKKGVPTPELGLDDQKAQPEPNPAYTKPLVFSQNADGPIKPSTGSAESPTLPPTSKGAPINAPSPLFAGLCPPTKLSIVQPPVRPATTSRLRRSTSKQPKSSSALKATPQFGRKSASGLSKLTATPSVLDDFLS